MKEMRLVAIGLMLLLVAVGCKEKAAKAPPQHKKVKISSCIPDQDPVHLSRGARRRGMEGGSAWGGVK
jgi:hypothetical protein